MSAPSAATSWADWDTLTQPETGAAMPSTSDVSGAVDLVHKSKTCGKFTPPVRKDHGTHGDNCSCPTGAGNGFVDGNA